MFLSTSAEIEKKRDISKKQDHILILAIKAVQLHVHTPTCHIWYRYIYGIGGIDVDIWAV